MQLHFCAKTDVIYASLASIYISRYIVSIIVFYYIHISVGLLLWKYFIKKFTSVECSNRIINVIGFNIRRLTSGSCVKTLLSNPGLPHNNIK